MFSTVLRKAKPGEEGKRGQPRQVRRGRRGKPSPAVRGGEEEEDAEPRLRAYPWR